MNSKGFTILELLIAIAVIAILTSVSFYGYNAKREKLTLDSEVNNIIGEIEHAREMSIASQEYTREGADPVMPKGGYGAMIEINSPGTVSLIADFDNDGTVPGENTDVIKHLVLDSRVAIKGLVSDQGACDWIIVLYKFPFPNAQITDNTGATSSDAYMVVVLKNDPSKEKRIYFNSAGLIYVQ